MENVRLESNLFGFGFLGWILGSGSSQGYSPVSVCPGTWIATLDLWCGDWQGISRMIMRNLFLFPKLRRLILNDLLSTDDFSLLFDQDMPALKELDLLPFRGCFRSATSRGVDYCYGPSVDRERSRTFFSRLVEVNFLDKSIGDEPEASLLLDAAHISGKSPSPKCRQTKS
ncbi:hypothetical protein HK102_013730, partial [Quaeritorhiza haematococci]